MGSGVPRLLSTYRLYLYIMAQHGEQPIHAGVPGSKLGSSPKSLKSDLISGTKHQREAVRSCYTLEAFLIVHIFGLYKMYTIEEKAREEESLHEDIPSSGARAERLNAPWHMSLRTLAICLSFAFTSYQEYQSTSRCAVNPKPRWILMVG